MVKNYYLISDAAKLVNVESHVLRYWEEELKLPIKRNELGHRYYTEKDVERFREIKELKEQGFQLKAIRMFLKDGKLSVEPVQVAEAALMDQAKGSEGHAKADSEKHAQEGSEKQEKAVSEEQIVTGGAKQAKTGNAQQVEKLFPEKVTGITEKEEKARRLQWLLQQMIAQTLQENNQELCRDLKESVAKELDYQFRLQEQREDAREEEKSKRQEEYYQKLDELLRLRSRKDSLFRKNEKKEKRKRHSIF